MRRARPIHESIVHASTGPALSRRGFLIGATALGGLGLMPGGIPSALAARDGTLSLTSSHFGAFYAQVEGNQVTHVVPFDADPDPTPMITNFTEVLGSRARVLRPAVRESYLRDGPAAGGQGRGAERFVEVDWDTALDLVATEMQRVKREYGNRSIYGGSYGWSSAGRLHAADDMTCRLLGAFGGYINDETNYSYGAGMVLLPHVLGNNQAIGGPFTSWDDVVRHSEFIVLFGGAAFKNGQITFGGSGEHTVPRWFRHASMAGIEMVAINPIAEDEVLQFDIPWLAPRPNTDTAMMLAMIHVLDAEGLADHDFMERYTVGADQVLAYVRGESDGVAKTPQWAEAITGIEAQTIADLARRMAAKRTIIMTAWSLQRAHHGEQPWWATIALAAALGQIGLPGGGFSFSHTSINGYDAPPSLYTIPGLTRGDNPVDLAIPVARIADLLNNPGETIDFDGQRITFPEVKLIYWAGGNPFHHHQDINRLLAGWRRPDTVIIQEQFWTATAKHADIVLPANTFLERNDIGFSSRDDYVFAMRRVVDAPGEARSDYEILSDLARRLGPEVEETFTEGRDEMGWLRHFWDRARERAAVRDLIMPTFEEFWQAGVYEFPPRERDYVYLADFRADPERYDLGTPSGKIELYSQTIAGFGYDDCPPHPTWMEPAEWLSPQAEAEGALHLISSHPQYRLHSQLDQGPVSRAAKVAEREPLWLNPLDAEARGIADGDVVEVFNDRGRMLAGAVVTARIRPGVVMMHEGAWYDPQDRGQIGTLDKHGQVNLVTLDIPSSRLGQGCAAQTCLVRVARFEGTPPPVTAFDPPPGVAV